MILAGPQGMGIQGVDVPLWMFFAHMVSSVDQRHIGWHWECGKHM